MRFVVKEFAHVKFRSSQTYILFWCYVIMRCTKGYSPKVHTVIM